jgi:hypothetical protein
VSGIRSVSGHSNTAFVNICLRNRESLRGPWIAHECTEVIMSVLTQIRLFGAVAKSIALAACLLAMFWLGAMAGK